MAAHRDHRRRHGPASASPWKLIVGAIVLLYVVFLVRVNVWSAADPRANAIVGEPARVIHAKNAAIVAQPSERDLLGEHGGGAIASTSSSPKLQLRTASEVESSTATIVSTPLARPAAAIDTTKPPAVAAERSTPTTNKSPVAALTHVPVHTATGVATTRPVDTDAQAPTEPVAVAATGHSTVAVEEEKAAHDHETDDGVDDLEASIHLAIATPRTGGIGHATATALAPTAPTFESRHDVIAGFEQTKEYLQNYNSHHVNTDGNHASPSTSLYLFFTCSDDDGNAHDWSTLCVEARKQVYGLFSKSPATNRLVTIRAGSEEFWEYRNAFSNDRDLRVKSVPCVMKWEGKPNGETSGMLVGASLLIEPFLRYLFQNRDKPDALLAPAATHTKHIVTLSSRAEYDAYMMAYEQRDAALRTPLYLLFVSGRIADNNRPWCPYCRFSELPAEYSFLAFAPPHARLVRIEVTPTYAAWKQPNAFNTDPVLGLRGVPAFFRVRSAPAALSSGSMAAAPVALGSNGLVYERIIERFDLMETWRAIYSAVV